MLSRAVALEWAAAGVRVNAVGPGPIQTSMTLPIPEANPALRAQWESRVPLGRLGEPEDIADACLFLVSPAARWISGQNLAVDGGMLATRIY